MTNQIEMTFTTRQAILVTFMLGFIIGGTGIGALQQLDTPTGAITEDNQGNTPANTDTNNNPSPPSTGDTTTKIDMSKIEMKGEPVLGQEDAPVTMVVYEDFQCPFCKRFEQGAFPQIVENYVKTGKVKVVWKDFPLPRLHPWAEPAAAAMECVYRQDNAAFWAVKKKIFDNQNTLSPTNVQSKIKQWAAAEGVSKSAVQSCLDNDNPMQEVNADKQEGSSIGVSGTPTAFIDGKKLVGAQPYSRFKSAINSALNGGSDGSGTQSVDKTITVSGTEYSFSPSTITVTKGQTVRVKFTNTGRIPHNLRIPSLGVGSRTIRAGQTDSFTFTAPESGTFPIEFVCSLPGHAQNGMKGTLTAQ